MKKRYASVLALAVITIMASLAAPENLPIRDLTQIIASKKLVVAMVDMDHPPFITRTVDGRLEGLELEMARDIAKELEVTLEINKTATFDDVIDMVACGEADIGLSNLSITVDRAKKVNFTNVYRKLGIVLLLNRLKMAARNLETGMRHLDDLKNTSDTIGVIGKSAYETMALRYFPNANVKTYDQYEDMIIAAEKGEILLAMGNSGTIDAFLKKSPHLIIKLQSYRIEDLIDDIAMADAVGNDHLLSWLNSYLIVREPADPYGIR